MTFIHNYIKLHGRFALQMYINNNRWRELMDQLLILTYPKFIGTIEALNFVMWWLNNKTIPIIVQTPGSIFIKNIINKMPADHEQINLFIHTACAKGQTIDWADLEYITITTSMTNEIEFLANCFAETFGNKLIYTIFENTRRIHRYMEMEKNNFILTMITNNVKLLTCLKCIVSDNILICSELNDEICGICMDDFSENPFVRLKCKHIYHYTCLGIWLAHNMRCPMCRYKVKLD